MDQWERVAWSDESRFVIHRADGHIRIRRLLQANSCSLNVQYTGWWWQYYALGDVLLGAVVEQTMNATGYLNIIADQLHPYTASVSPAVNGMFQQDNGPRHKAKNVLE
ncbi:transposase domain containing protein [Trichonephila clavipes]|nr:transposase domain containing protein [Trichonephila clavipes]